MLVAAYFQGRKKTYQIFDQRPLKLEDNPKMSIEKGNVPELAASKKWKEYNSNVESEEKETK